MLVIFSIMRKDLVFHLSIADKLSFMPTIYFLMRPPSMQSINIFFISRLYMENMIGRMSKFYI